MKESRTKKGIWLLGQYGPNTLVRISLKTVRRYVVGDESIVFYGKKGRILDTFSFEDVKKEKKADEKICDVLEKGVDEGEECIYLEYKTVK